jgi:hypothetical protein
MYLLEEEGPNPVASNCTGVLLMQEGEFLQAYLLVSDLVECPTPDGYSALCYLKSLGGGYFLAPVADLYTVSKIEGTSS